ncbi:MAG: oligopeptide ABC transporter substrate-binding protein [Sporolactobacillus sp.]
MKKKLTGLLTALLLLTLVLTGCSGGSSSQNVNTSKFPLAVKNSKAAVKDGTLNVGLISDTPFQGTFYNAMIADFPDQEIWQWAEDPNGLLDVDKNYEITNKGAATYKYSNNNKTITITIKKGVDWSDGQPVTSQDLKYSYLVVGSPKYTGQQYGPSFSNVVGMDAYNSGKATDISGIKIINDRTLSITYTSSGPNLRDAVYSDPMPYHYLKDIPIDQLASAPQTTTNPIGYGAFVIKKIVPGESVQLVRNDHYWRGKPKLKYVNIKVVNPNVAVAAMKNGSIDMTMDMPNNSYQDATKNKNYQILGFSDLAYSYIGFKLGHWDSDKNVAVTDNNKLQNVKLRQAMGYALNLKAASDKLYQGVFYPANGFIVPAFHKYYDPSFKGFTYDVKKANKLLDEAGYKKGKDGYRTQPDGKKLVINFLAMSGSSVAEPLANYYIQCWKKVGLDVKLVDGRLHEFNSFYDMIEKDDKSVDIFAAAWSTGTDVDPTQLYSKDYQFNYERFVNSQNEKLLTEGTSPKAFDSSYRKQAYAKWNKLMKDQAPAIPTFFRYQIVLVNNRVKDYNVDPTICGGLQNVTVTSNTPAKGK